MTTEELILRAKTTYCNNVETEYLLWHIAHRLEELHNENSQLKNSSQNE